MQEVVQGTQVDEAQVPDGTASVSVQGSAGTSVSLAAPSLGTTTTRGGGIIVRQCTKHALNTYYATDHLGTVRFTKTIDDTGAVTTTTHDYEPFGVEITPTDECGNTHRFTGHERDLETGNDYMHFRFFSSNMGRFQKPDSNFDSPLSNPQGWNLYSYVKGNPVNFNDPTGHMQGEPLATKGVVRGGIPNAPSLLQNNSLGGGLSIGGTPFDSSFDAATEGALLLSDQLTQFNTMSNLGQTMNPPQATGQAAQTSIFGDNPFHLEPFKFNPPTPNLSGAQQKVAGEIAFEAGQQGVNQTLAVTVGFQESSLRNLAPAFNGNYYVYGVMQIDSSHLNETIAGVKVTDNSLKLEMTNIQVGVGLLAKAIDKTNAEAPGLTGEDYLRHIYARYQDPNVSLGRVQRVMQDPSVDKFVKNYLEIESLGY
jgi:RHS repeat-associated protein